MTEPILMFIDEHPFVLIVMLIALFLFFLLIAIMIFKGNEFISPIFSIKPKQKVDKTTDPIIQNNVTVTPYLLTEAQINELSIRIAQRVDEIKKLEKDIPTEFPFPISKIDNSVIYVFTIKRLINIKFREISFRSLGGWPGCSSCSLEYFYQLLLEFNLLSEEIIQQMNDLMMLIRQFDQYEKVPDHIVIDIQYLAFKLNADLDNLLVNLDTSESGYIDHDLAVG